MPRRHLCRQDPRRREAGGLPIEQASKFVLVLNLKTAKSLGVAAPDRLPTVADEVIE